MRFLLSLVLAAFAAHPAAAADWYILIPPKSLLDVEKFKAKYDKDQPGDANESNMYFSGFFGPKPEFVGAENASALPVKGQSYILEFPPAKFDKPKLQKQSGKFNGAAKSELFTYEFTRFEQPCRLWYVKEPGAKPELMGQYVHTDFASQLKSAGQPDEYILRKGKPEEIAREDIFKTYASLAPDAHWCVAEKLFTAKVHDKPSAAETKIWDDPFNHPKYYEFRQCYDDRMNIRYRASKVIVDPKGGAMVEVNLHNRLPTKVEGKVRFRILPSVPVKAPGRSADQIQDFALAPDEKVTLKFNVPADLAKAYKLVDAASIHLDQAQIDQTKRKGKFDK